MDLVKVTYPKRFEVYWLNLDHTVGSEVKKTRPCVVISPDSLNQTLQTVLVAPMTTIPKKWPFRIPITHKKTRGQVMLDQIRVASKKRLHKADGRVSSKTQDDILECLNHMFMR
jgi:mRNA interferase MazF